MTTREYQKKKPLQIFLGYFAAHKRLFAARCALQRST